MISMYLLIKAKQCDKTVDFRSFGYADPLRGKSNPTETPTSTQEH